MCMFCAAIPAAAAVGAKLNADQKNALAQQKIDAPKPIVAMTTGVIILLAVGSVTYHTLAYR